MWQGLRLHGFWSTQFACAGSRQIGGHGMARQGKARQGKARQGKARPAVQRPRCGREIYFDLETFLKLCVLCMERF